MVRRYALRDDQWDATKDLLPGQEETAGCAAGADVLLPDIVAKTVLADKGYNADARYVNRWRKPAKRLSFPPHPIARMRGLATSIGTGLGI